MRSSPTSVFCTLVFLPDFEVGHQLQRFHHAGVVPGAAAVRRATVEQLLGGSGVGQRDADGAALDSARLRSFWCSSRCGSQGCCG